MKRIILTIWIYCFTPRGEEWEWGWVLAWKLAGIRCGSDHIADWSWGYWEAWRSHRASPWYQQSVKDLGQYLEELE